MRSTQAGDHIGHGGEELAPARRESRNQVFRTSIAAHTCTLTAVPAQPAAPGASRVRGPSRQHPRRPSSRLYMRFQGTERPARHPTVCTTCRHASDAVEMARSGVRAHTVIGTESGVYRRAVSSRVPFRGDERRMLETCTCKPVRLVGESRRSRCPVGKGKTKEQDATAPVTEQLERTFERAPTETPKRPLRRHS